MTVKYIKNEMIHSVLDFNDSNTIYTLNGNDGKYTVQTYGTGLLTIYGTLFGYDENKWIVVATLTNNDVAVFETGFAHLKFEYDSTLSIKVLERDV